MPQSLVLNANRVRYTYLKSTVDTKVPLRKITDNFNDYNSTTFTHDEKLEFNFGSQAVTSDRATITHSVAFANVPTVIMSADDDVNILLQPATSTVSVYLSDALSTTLSWIAVNNIGVTNNSSATRVAMLVDAGTISFNSESSVTVTYNKSVNFKKYADTYDLTPIVLTNTNTTVKSYVASVTSTNFIFNTSEIFTGTCYWMAFLARRL